MTVSIKQLSENELDVFIHFPFELYRKDPYWVGELKTDTRKLISANHPFWEKGARALFMAYQDEKPVGRLMALVNGAHNTYYQEKMGFFGFLIV